MTWKDKRQEIIVKLTGKRFGRLVIVKFSHQSPTRAYYYVCRCDCGNTSIVRIGHLRRGKIVSCGCFSQESHMKHGHNRRGRRTREYSTWDGMIQRCTNSKHKYYSYYGGRSILVCDRWKFSFDNFLNDMGIKPEGKTLDRIDVNGNYEPGNVRWATWKEQANNRRDNAKKTECLY